MHKRKRNYTRKQTRCYRGGDYTQKTEMTYEGVPLEKEAVVDVVGFGTMSVTEFENYVNNMDVQGRR